MARKDQVRDRDSIQPWTITTDIAGPVDVELRWSGFGKLHVLLIKEPAESANRGEAKFSFIFQDLAAVNAFADKIKRETVRLAAEEAKSR